MASDQKPADLETETTKAVEEPPRPPKSTSLDKCVTVDVVLRVVLFAATLTSLLVLVYQQSVKAPPRHRLSLRRRGGGQVQSLARFHLSCRYLAAAASVTCLYSIITILASISVLLKPAFNTSFLIFFAIWDVVILGVMASATGAAGAVAYIGLKGNRHTNWAKVCNVYDKFCQHLAGSIAVALFASIVLVFLIVLSVLSLHKKIPK
ncbi:hypothetical protein SAY86_007137 [Trapa natans]|uniref:CASP-like protein n=1 Tax=Trapa natans TaxID=22666 RepID=A0AAN7R1U5_TRANT|nr:hypothetical protein SAY86_007137 [Trapa natans]